MHSKCLQLRQCTQRPEAASWVAHMAVANQPELLEAWQPGQAQQRLRPKIWFQGKGPQAGELCQSCHPPSLQWQSSKQVKVK